MCGFVRAGIRLEAYVADRKRATQPPPLQACHQRRSSEIGQGYHGLCQPGASQPVIARSITAITLTNRANAVIIYCYSYLSKRNEKDDGDGVRAEGRAGRRQDRRCGPEKAIDAHTALQVLCRRSWIKKSLAAEVLSCFALKRKAIEVGFAVATLYLIRLSGKQIRLAEQGQSSTPAAAGWDRLQSKIHIAPRPKPERTDERELSLYAATDGSQLLMNILQQAG